MKVVVGKTFDDIVMDSQKDVLIEFYAPWCGHCKKIEPEYLALGKKYKGEKNLVIAKMDATANDVPYDSYKVEGFPTIYFAPSNSKQNPVKLEGGDRTVEGLSKFVEKHATKLSQKKDELWIIFSSRDFEEQEKGTLVRSGQCKWVTEMIPMFKNSFGFCSFQEIWLFFSFWRHVSTVDNF